MKNSEMIIKTRRNFLNRVMSSGRKIGITWVAKKGETTANPSLKRYESHGRNTVAHKPELFTLWCNKRNRFANVNLETLMEVRADHKVYKFK